MPFVRIHGWEGQCESAAANAHDRIAKKGAEEVDTLDLVGATEINLAKRNKVLLGDGPL